MSLLIQVGVAQAGKPNAVYLRNWLGCLEDVSSLGGIEAPPEPRRTAGRDMPAPDEAVPRLRGAAESGVGPQKEEWSLEEAAPDPHLPWAKSVPPHPAAQDGACRVSVWNPGLRCAPPGARKSRPAVRRGS